MCHYDKTKKSKRRNCSLKILDLLNVSINEELYEKYIEVFSELNNPNEFKVRLTNALRLYTFTYKYSKELLFLKILIDIDKRIGVEILSQEIFDFIEKGKVTHNLTMQNKKDLNDLIDKTVNSNQVHRFVPLLPFFNSIIA